MADLDKATQRGGVGRAIGHGLTRRGIIGRGAAAGTAGLAAAAGVRSEAFARGQSSPRFGAPMLQTGLTGEITVGYADELGAKPPYVEAAAEAVRAANPDATVNIDLREIGGGEYTTQLLLQLDSNDGPDVIHIGGDRIGALADSGYIEPLDAYVAAWEDWEAQYPQAVRDGVAYNGSTWAIPYGLDTRFLYYRKDLLTQAGLSADWQPANLDGILEAATAVKEAGIENVLPYALYAGTQSGGGAGSAGFAPVLFAYGGAMIDDAGKWIGQSPALLDTFAYYQRAWRELEVVPREILTTAEPWKPMREGMGTGRVALLFEGGWVYGGYVTRAATGEIDLSQIGYLLHPTVDAGPSFTIGGPGTVWYINAASENKDLAWEFIKAFNNAETVAALNIEDPHPVARLDSAQLPAFQENQFLVDSTDSLETARFLPNSPALNDVITAIQRATGAVADGQSSPEEAAERYMDDLVRAVGEENVVTR